MFSSIVLILAAGAGIAGAVHLVRANESIVEQGRKWLADSIDAWRANELDGTQFDVHVEEVELGDLFTQFEHDDADPYYSSEGIEEHLVEVTGSNLPKKIVDSVELTTLRAIDAAKAVKAKRAARGA
ncbi:hypothetical protein J2S70_001505 [Trueperella bonasi]|uniref:Uncharacterized protein n=1 Tax=Trueperella bonasi TaxID=312286 RepID=A0ABT9NIR6_9ACTO|nr:hypothetical protein [Trueperella bonasi]MDP9806923.1 hypothetical protein [Trueperella bonasi]